jgi:Berberine and berberine like
LTERRGEALIAFPSEWVTLRQALQPGGCFAEASTGRAYVNFLGDAEAARDAYGEETYERLVSLKSEYDPTNVFRLNQNIVPQPPAA